MRSLNHSAVLALVLAAAFSSSAAWAAGSSPTGLWTSIDDVSGKGVPMLGRSQIWERKE